MKSICRRILVLSFDGVTPEYVRHWAEEGKLEHITALMGTGTHGLVRSTMPPLSPCAWVSFYTGKNPGKHGVFSSFTAVGWEAPMDRVRFDDVKAKPFWQLLSEQGRNVIIVSVPITYPPHPVNGILVSGKDTPDKSATFTYPPELQSFLHERGFEIVVNHRMLANVGAETFMKECIRIMEKKAEIAVELLQDNAWDFGIVHFGETDVVSHYLRDRMTEIYQVMDRIVGAFVSSSPDDTNFIILSDHGNLPCSGTVYLNKLLLQLGLLRIGNKQEHVSILRECLKKFGLSRESVRAFCRGVGLEDLLRCVPRLVRRTVPSSNNSLSLVDVDWEATKAYTIGGYWICLNSHLTDVELNQLARECEQLGIELYRKEDIYHGEQLKNAPDIVVYRENYLMSGRILLNSTTLLGPSEHRPGEHSLYGFFVASGPEIATLDEEITVSIMDFVPTILHLQGVPLLEDLDGQILYDLIRRS